jgi:hypothetical protein
VKPGIAETGIDCPGRLNFKEILEAIPEQDAARKAYEQLSSGELDYLPAKREKPVS